MPTSGKESLIQPSQIPEYSCPYQDKGMVLLTGTSNIPLANKIAKILKQDIEQPVTLFKNGETKVSISHELNRKDIFIIQSPTLPFINNHIMELLLMIDAARRASAFEITVVLPNYPYARQDRKDKPRVPISASFLADLIIKSGAHRIVTVDLHAEQTEGSVLAPWDNLYASHSLVPIMKQEIDSGNTVMVSPDIGAIKRTTHFADKLGLKDIAIIDKVRNSSNGDPNCIFLIGNVKGKDVWLTDDVLQSGKSMVAASMLLNQNGAKSIKAAVTQGEFTHCIIKGVTEDALSLIEDSPIEKVLITDSLHLRRNLLNHPKIQVVSIAPLLADAIQRIHRGQPLNPLFI